MVRPPPRRGRGRPRRPCGFARTSAGVPSAMTSPWSSTVTRSLMPMTTRMSCSMSSTVRPSSARRRRMKSVISRVSLLFMPAVGSSSRSSFGRVPRARAISSRRWSPYGRLRAQVSAALVEADQLEEAHALVDRVLLLVEHARACAGTASHQWLLRWTLMPTRTLSRADIVPNSRMFWNVRPMPSAVTSWGLQGLELLAPHGHDRLAVESISPVGRRVGAGDHVEEGRLAGAVRADERDDRAARDVEVDVVDRQQATEPLGHAAGPDEELGRRGWRRSARLGSSCDGHSVLASPGRLRRPASAVELGLAVRRDARRCRVSTSTPISASAVLRGRATLSSAARWRLGRKPSGRNRIISHEDHPKIRKLNCAGSGIGRDRRWIRWPSQGRNVLSM